MDPVTTSGTLATSFLSRRTASRRAYKVPAIRHNLEDFLPDSDIITLLRVDATFFEDVVPSVWAQAPVEAVLACDPKVATKEKEAFRHRLYCSCTLHFYDIVVHANDIDFSDCATILSPRQDFHITSLEARLRHNDAIGLDQFLSNGSHLKKLLLDLQEEISPQLILVIVKAVPTYLRSLKEFRLRFTTEVDPEIESWPLIWRNPNTISLSLEEFRVSVTHAPTAEDLEMPGRLERMVERILGMAWIVSSFMNGNCQVHLTDNMLKHLDCQPFLEPCQKASKSMQEIIPHIPLDGTPVSHLPILGAPPPEEMLLDHVRETISMDVVMYYATRRRYLSWGEDNDL
ncbi:hypothetical protein TREMEDRAFT_66175 [Tremella mesenterica DSM 1558]|uniref:uncharacterized protein n=1 Tax=Tremella mesenterica (strain ATCC 24925 / CBS 8224 / DSM 1558 / NBRC 9311 / NRRL Y-6157 / RJB 2259-6 / UBC 559-6) TaxID=578456 RepID=UPI00032D0F52|nr:uncharacterized protein TREMEDRAFT_66175 [Tremella mesenterica DSM 1558]EIW65806.1 hypothetical protein TREMEDRAFT_66175 [Tremella mesenterica DSM 1558]